MSGTITATTGNGQVVFNAITGDVVGGDYRGIEDIKTLVVDLTAENLGLTVNELCAQGCKLVYCTFYLKCGARHPSVPYPYK